MPPDPKPSELDDDVDEAHDGDRVTAPPPFEPDAFAREIERAGARITQPPAPAYEVLRESCKVRIAPEAIPDATDDAPPPKAGASTAPKR
jgi:hypothetical protein